MWKLLLLFIIYKIVSPFLFLPSEIKELNKNIQFTHFDFKFGDKLSEIGIEQLKEDGWEEKADFARYRVMSYYNKNNEAFTFRGFPDLSNEFKFTSYGTDKKNNMNVFGFGIGDNIAKAHEILTSFRYNTDNRNKRTYYKGRITISIAETQGEIIGISIRLKSSDWFFNGNYK